MTLAGRSLSAGKLLDRDTRSRPFEVQLLRAFVFGSRNGRYIRFVTRIAPRSVQVRSKRSSVITLVHAFTKSCTNFSRPSSEA